MKENPGLRGLEQGRAEFAFSCAEKACLDEEIKSEYRQYVKKIPMLIKTNGLGATFAFIKAKSNKESARGKAYKLINDQTFEWLQHKNIIEIVDNDLEKSLVRCNSDIYRVTTVEVLALFKWLSRFAEGLIKGRGKTNG
jgi:CRISPR-associated protein Cmr5